jgi:hypothetical protein
MIMKEIKILGNKDVAKQAVKDGLITYEQYVKWFDELTQQTVYADGVVYNMKLFCLSRDGISIDILYRNGHLDAIEHVLSCEPQTGHFYSYQIKEKETYKGIYKLLLKCAKCGNDINKILQYVEKDEYGQIEKIILKSSNTYSNGRMLALYFINRGCFEHCVQNENIRSKMMTSESYYSHRDIDCDKSVLTITQLTDLKTYFSRKIIADLFGRVTLDIDCVKHLMDIDCVKHLMDIDYVKHLMDIDCVKHLMDIDCVKHLMDNDYGFKPYDIKEILYDTFCTALCVYSLNDILEFIDVYAKKYDLTELLEKAIYRISDLTNVKVFTEIIKFIDPKNTKLIAELINILAMDNNAEYCKIIYGMGFSFDIKTIIFTQLGMMKNDVLLVFQDISECKDALNMIDKVGYITTLDTYLSSITEFDFKHSDPTYSIDKLFSTYVRHKSPYDLKDIEEFEKINGFTLSKDFKHYLTNYSNVISWGKYNNIYSRTTFFNIFEIDIQKYYPCAWTPTDKIDKILTPSVYTHFMNSSECLYDCKPYIELPDFPRPRFCSLDAEYNMKQTINLTISDKIALVKPDKIAKMDVESKTIHVFHIYDADKKMLCRVQDNEYLPRYTGNTVQICYGGCSCDAFMILDGYLKDCVWCYEVCFEYSNPGGALFKSFADFIDWKHNYRNVSYRKASGKVKYPDSDHLKYLTEDN